VKYAFFRIILTLLCIAIQCTGIQRYWYAKVLVCKGPPLHQVKVSIPSSGSIQFLQRRFQVIVEQSVARSKKTAMVKGGLRGWGAYFLTLFN